MASILSRPQCVNLLIFFTKQKHIYLPFTILVYTDVAGGWNPSSAKERAHLSYSVNTMVAGHQQQSYWPGLSGLCGFYTKISISALRWKLWIFFGNQNSKEIWGVLIKKFSRKETSEFLGQTYCFWSYCKCHQLFYMRCEWCKTAWGWCNTGNLDSRNPEISFQQINNTNFICLFAFKFSRRTGGYMIAVFQVQVQNGRAAKEIAMVKRDFARFESKESTDVWQKTPHCFWYGSPLYLTWGTLVLGNDGTEHNSGLILGLRPANERRRYKVTPSLIGWAQT